MISGIEVEMNGQEPESALGRLLWNKGIQIKELGRWLVYQKCYISYSTMRKYIAASDINYGKPEVWKLIRKFLKMHQIEWDGTPNMEGISRPKRIVTRKWENIYV